MSRSRLSLSIALAILLVPICSLRLCADDATNRPDDNSANGPGDNYVHYYTGFTFPLQVSVFKRVRITPFNANASDVGVDYNNDPLTVHILVNIYPAKGSTEAHYELCRDQVAQVHPDAKLTEEKPLTLNKGGAMYDGYSALFTYQGKFTTDTNQELVAKLLVFRYGDFFVTYRLSYSEDDHAAAEKLVDDFVQKLEWPPPTPSTPAPAPTPASAPTATPSN